MTIPPVTIPPVEWVAGFVEGEGTFTHVPNQNEGQNRYPHFAVTQKEVQPLESVAAFFADNGVYGTISPPAGKDGARYVVWRPQDCLRVARLLVDHMHSDRKKAQIVEWVRQILLWQRAGSEPLPSGMNRPHDLKKKEAWRHLSLDPIHARRLGPNGIPYVITTREDVERLCQLRESGDQE